MPSPTERAAATTKIEFGQVWDYYPEPSLTTEFMVIGPSSEPSAGPNDRLVIWLGGEFEIGTMWGFDDDPKERLEGYVRLDEEEA